MWATGTGKNTVGELVRVERQTASEHGKPGDPGDPGDSFSARQTVMHLAANSDRNEKSCNRKPR